MNGYLLVSLCRKSVMTDERADAIPETWTLTICKRSGQLPWECGLAACDNGCDTRDIEVVLAAAAPHMIGSGDAERLRAALREVAAWIDCMERPGPLAQESRRKIAEALSAQPDAERAPQGDYGSGMDIARAMQEDHARADAERVPQWTCPACGTKWGLSVLGCDTCGHERAPQDTYDPERATIAPERAPQGEDFCPKCGLMTHGRHAYTDCPPAHVHEWVDARNRIVLSGEVCLGCGAVRASDENA